MKAKSTEILEAARKEAQTVKSWADLYNFLFDADIGIVSKAFPERAERRAFMASDDFQAIQRLIEQAQDETGLVEGSTPTKSGKFVVRLPRSLHAALEIEAKREGVSLNQLVVAKLAVPMSGLFAKSTA